MKRVMIFILICTTLLIAGCSSQTDSQEKGTWDRLNVEQMNEELKTGEAVIVDLREPELYTKSHIPGSINIPFTEFQDRYQELSPDQRIIFVCHNGPMGEASSQLLVEKGYQHVANLVGGMADWKGLVDKTNP